MDRILKLKEYLANSPQDSFLQHALGLEYIKLGDDEQAEIYFKNLLNENPAYVGTYYHFGKLLERAGNTEAAIAMYETGMKQAKSAGDMHAYSELQAAQEDLLDY